MIILLRHRPVCAALESGQHFWALGYWGSSGFHPSRYALQLNIFTARLASTKPGSTILGYAYSPWDVQSNAVHDGVFINDRTLPGGSAVSGSVVYNKGVVTVHEVRRQ